MFFVSYRCLFMDQTRKKSGNKAYVAAVNKSKGSLSSLKQARQLGMIDPTSRTDAVGCSGIVSVQIP